MKAFYILLLSCCFVSASWAQKAMMEELDLQPDGNYYQRFHQEPFTGVAIENYENGKKKSRAEFKNGKLDGKVTTWHETGEKSTLVNYKKGIVTGTEIHWYDTGVKKLEVSYDSEGLASGVCKEYYHNETLKSEGRYEKDLEEGLHKWYFKNGDLDQTIEYKGGMANGKVKHYYQGGKIKMDGDYKAGRPNGKVIHYYNNGQRKKETNYTDGIENGKDYLWSKKGLLFEERDYVNGEEKTFMNFRSGAIKTKEGYLQVFNEKESFFHLHLDAPGWVRPRSSKDITYVVDDFVLQIFNSPVSEFTKEKGLSDEEVLDKHMAFEKAYIEKATKSTINVQSQIKRYKSGTYLHWSFESPGLKDVKFPSNKTVEAEHYFTFVCNQQILTLYVPKTKGNDGAKILKAIQQIADSLSIESERIDLNAMRITIRKNEGLPPLPANETVKGYKKNGQK